MSVNSIFLNETQSPALTFSNDISYSIEGDQAQLGAGISSDIEKLNTAHYCSLQLWACNNPYFGGVLEGKLVAEVPVNPHFSDSFLQQSAQALLPAGQHDYAMVMALASQNDNGELCIHDYTNFPNRQQFLQPQLQGKVSAVLRDRQVQIHVDRISNPRAESSLSGSLSLELWATREPYRGGEFEGHWMAGVELGQLPGKNDWVHNEFTLDLNPAPEGGWSVVLMLREWNGAAYETRDYYLLPPLLKPAIKSTVVPLAEKQPEQNLEQQKPVEQKPAEQKSAELKPAEPKPAEAKPVEAKLVEAKTVEIKEVAAQPQETSTVEIEPVEVKPAEIESAEIAPAVQKPVQKDPVETSRPDQKQKEVAKADTEADKKVKAEEVSLHEVVSINTASTKELSKVKGLSLHVAKLIVANRPYEKLDDLIKVKGIGEKSLSRLRSHLGL